MKNYQKFIFLVFFKNFNLNLLKCQTILESYLNSEIKTCISEEVKILVDEKTKLQKELEYFEDENYKLTEDFEKMKQQNLNFQKKLQLLENNKNQDKKDNMESEQVSENLKSENKNLKLKLETFSKNEEELRCSYEKIKREYEKLLKTHAVNICDNERSNSKRKRNEEDNADLKSSINFLEIKHKELEKINYDLSLQNTYQKQRIDNLSKELENNMEVLKGRDLVLEEKENIIRQLKEQEEISKKEFEEKYDKLFNVLSKENEAKWREDEKRKIKIILNEFLNEIKGFFLGLDKAKIEEIEKYLNNFEQQEGEFNTSIQKLGIYKDIILDELQVLKIFQ